MSSDALWYLGRGTGVVSLLLLTLVVALGVAIRSGRPLPGLPRFGLVSLHRTVSLLAVSTLTVHVATMVADPYAQVRLVDVLLPFRAGYRPLWVGLGALSLDVMLALVITSLLRHRIGARTWRAVHWSAYALFPLAVAHAVGSGTDVSFTWMRLLAIGSCATVTAAVAWRMSPGFGEHARTRRRRTAVTPATPVRPSTAAWEAVR